MQNYITKILKKSTENQAKTNHSTQDQPSRYFCRHYNRFVHCYCFFLFFLDLQPTWA